MFGAVSNIQMADKYKKVDASIIKVSAKWHRSISIIKMAETFFVRPTKFFLNIFPSHFIVVACVREFINMYVGNAAANSKHLASRLHVCLICNATLEKSTRET